MNATIKIKIELPQTPRGAATKYAWECNRATAVAIVGNYRVIIAATAPLRSLKSENFSTLESWIYSAFAAEWEGVTLTPSELNQMIPAGVPGSRAVKLALREMVYNAD